MAAPRSLFVSHGSPMIALNASSASQFLSGLGRTMPRPRAVLAVSAHWQAGTLHVGAAANPRTIHDFLGFPPALYAIDYPAPGLPQLAQTVASLTGAELDPGRGLDHGIWTVASLLWPGGDVPIVPLSLMRGRGADDHWRLGEKLRPLLEDGVLLLASGAATHNLAAYVGRALASPVPPWVGAFADWLGQAVAAGDRQSLLDYRRQAPRAQDNHPSDEHLLPLFVAAGAGQGSGRVLHRSVDHGVLAMDTYGWA